MKYDAKYIANLIYRSLSDELSVEEAQALQHWLVADSRNLVFFERISEEHFLQQDLQAHSPAIMGNLRQELYANIKEDIGLYHALPPSIPAPIQPIIKKRTRLRYTAAAVFILAIGSGVYYLNNQSYKSNKSSQITVQTKEPQAIPPGTNKAILTFSNGTQKELSPADNGLQLQSDALLLTTPNGGQYHAVLPDGSKVWLNAASSIKFPSTFTDKERRVAITGEVYFEIAKDVKRPFKVTSAGQEIEVLGTSFNINVYGDEPTKKTTLISGSIKITSNNQTAILKPGQQANIPILSILPIRLIPVQTINPEQEIAWKNGFFSFNKVPLPVVLRQLARWYDLNIKYEGTGTNQKLIGKLSRDLPLSEALKVLEDFKINFRMEGKTLIIQ